MKYLSVCSGIEAATVAWHPLGWQAVGYSEIEKFPSQVLAHHYPNVPNFGNMTKFKEWNLESNVDVFVGGTPCQSFSVAGLRKGLDDPRGNLMLTYLAIADKYRPRWLVWENVPGVLSSNGGKDFGTFLGGLGELGYGFAYRVLDAQYFGVAQRRRRVFVVGYLGDWRRAAAVLFERHSLSGDSAPLRKKREGVTSSIGDSTQGGFDCGIEIMSVYENHPADSRVQEMGEVCSTVTSRWGTGGGNLPMVNAIGVDTYNGTETGQVSCTITADVGGPTHSGPKVMQAMAVRRLLPKECERLQGFPDDYTDIKPNGKQTSDGSRYKALGNSMAVPVMAWIGKRIQEVENL